ncbi:MAG: peptidyl-prolyl cis-trans isomerase [Deltaproteobacteria bacterium]|nr:MAG: peptidyl-prolyl cis-trans isomerase [Deltaproteobacteria bacterium]
MRSVLMFAFFFAMVAQASGGEVDSKKPKVTVETSKGKIVLELFPVEAPQTVDNFVAYVGSKHYDGTIFHRVIPNFMIQGGGFTPDMKNKPTGKPILNEADNGLKNDRGTIAMARTGDPHSATAQFFINTVNNDFLNYRSKKVQAWGYAVFGRVVEGMDVVDTISRVPTGTKGRYRDVPMETVVIYRMRVQE